MKNYLKRHIIAGVLVVTLGLFTASFNVVNAGGVIDVFTTIFAPIIDLVTLPLVVITGNTPNLGDILGGPLGGLIACSAFDTNGVYWNDCGGAAGAFPAINTADSGGGCGIPIVFYIPQLNTTTGNLPTGYSYTPPITGRARQLTSTGTIPAGSQKYSNTTCTASDPNGGYVSVNISGLGQKCATVTQQCNVIPNGIDETSRTIEIYRFTKPNSISSRDESAWYFNTIKGAVGKGYISKPGMLMEYYTSAAPQLLATKPYSDICHVSGAGVNECRFFDNTAPKNSYVAYVLKIVGPYGAIVQDSKTCTRSGCVTPPPKCVSNQNKYLTTASSTDTTLFPYAKSATDYSSGNLISGPYNTGQLVCMQKSSVSLNGPGSVFIPNPISLLWNGQGVSSCTASGGWNGVKSANGVETVMGATTIADRGSHTYSLSCTSDTGTTTVSASTTVIVKQAPSCSFTANIDSVIPPQSAILSWNCSYANSCSINTGIGSVSSQSGSVTVRPTATTTYTLTCSSPDASVPFNKTITVSGSPRLHEVSP